MSLLLTTSVRLQGKPLARELDVATENPQLAQQQLLQKILYQNAGTVFGKEHYFDQITTVRDYRRNTPIRDYEAFRPYVERIINREDAILTAAKPLMFALTSGTTSAPKYIPVTKAFEEQGSCLMQQWLYRTLLDHPQCLSGATVGVVSPAIEGFTNSHIAYGSVSGRIYQRIPAMVRSSYAIPYPVFELKHYDERYLAIARFAIAQSVSLISTPNPSTLIRLATLVTQHQEKLIQAIYDGTVGVNLKNELITKIQRFLKPDPRRARELEEIVQRTGTLLPKDYWSNLKLISCWTGGSVGVQVQKLAAYFGNLPIRDLGYLASEARITIPYQDNTPSGILAINTNFYEFIPESDIESERPTILSCHELELGKRYSILLTTTAGLYRYHINDIVEVTGFYKKTPLLAFIRKGQDMTNITGEKMHVNHVVSAIAQVQQQFSLAIAAYRLIPNLENNRYELYLELTTPASRQWLQQTLIPTIDRALCEVNNEYAQKRATQRLQPLCLHLVQLGWSKAELQRIVANGQRDVQYKWQILRSQPSSEDRQAIATTVESHDTFKLVSR